MSQFLPAMSQSPLVKRAPTGRIYVPRPGPVAYWQITSSAVLGVLTHYLRESGRTVPCTADHLRGRQCHVDHRETSTRWQGWIAIQNQRGSEGNFFGLTEGAVSEMPELAWASPSIRGLTLGICRPGGTKRSKLKVFRAPEQWGVENLLPEPNVLAFLLNLWGPLLTAAATVHAWNDAVANKGGV